MPKLTKRTQLSRTDGQTDPKCRKTSFLYRVLIFIYDLEIYEKKLNGDWKKSNIYNV